MKKNFRCLHDLPTFAVRLFKEKNCQVFSMVNFFLKKYPLQFVNRDPRHFFVNIFINGCGSMLMNVLEVLRD